MGIISKQEKKGVIPTVWLPKVLPLVPRSEPQLLIYSTSGVMWLVLDIMSIKLFGPGNSCWSLIFVCLILWRETSEGIHRSHQMNKVPYIHDSSASVRSKVRTRIKHFSVFSPSFYHGRLALHWCSLKAIISECRWAELISNSPVSY